MAYVKSLFWLVSFGGLGYALLKTVTPNDSDLVKLMPQSQAQRTQQAAFSDVLKNAALQKDPMYRKIQQEIDSTIPKAQAGPPTAAK